MRDQGDIPVYTDPASFVPPSPPAVRPPEPAATPRPSRAVRMSFRQPLAILPWIGVIATLIWLPLGILGALWTIGAWRRGYRGALLAGAALLLVAGAHWLNGHLIHPFF